MAAEKLREAAIAYAARGWAVFPLQPRSKEPATTNGFKDATTDAETIDGWWSRHPNCNIGIATGSPSGGIFVIDVDVDDDKGKDGMATLRQWEGCHTELPETVSAITGRGGSHLLYHCTHEVKCSANDDKAVDVRGDGGYIVVPPSVHPDTGRNYEWENDPEDFAVVEADKNVLEFVESVRKHKRGEKFRLPAKIKEGGRNDTLYKLACSMQAKGDADDVIYAYVHGVNRTRVEPSLTDDEIDKIVSSALEHGKGDAEPQNAAKTSPDGGWSPQIVKKGKVLHNVFAKLLIDEDHACFIDGMPAVWDGRRYAAGWNEVERAIVRRYDACRQADQREIRHYIQLMAPRTPPSDALMVAFENGVMDMVEGFKPYTPDMVITNIIPWDYDADAYDEHVDVLFDRISCGDTTVRANLEEIIGMCMYRSNEFGQCPVLLGSGSNGKSTYLNALSNVLGSDNVSSLDISVLGKQFQATRVMGKLANIGDDISNEYLKGDMLAVFKKVVTGERIYSDVKNGEGLEFRPYCTLVFSCNEFPRLGDSSDGMMRRLFPIRFDAKFSRNDPDYNPRVGKLVTTENAAKYLCKLGVFGLQRLVAQNGMTPNNYSEAMVTEVKTDNDTFCQWAETECIDASCVVDKAVQDVYEQYADWCDSNRVKAVGGRSFTRKVNEKFGTESRPDGHVSERAGRKTIRVFREK